MATPENRKYHLDSWAALFKAKTWEDLQMLTEEYEELKSASEKLYVYNADQEMRDRCEARERYLLEESRKEKRMAMLEQELEEQRLVMQEKDNALQEKDNALQEKDNALQEKDNALQEQNIVLKAQEEKIAAMEKLLQKMEV